MSFTSGPEAALNKFGFREHIASNKAAWPVIKIEGSRITTIGLTIWGLYLGGHLEAMDILFAAMGWMAVIDGVVCSEHARPGSALFPGVFHGCSCALGLAWNDFRKVHLGWESEFVIHHDGLREFIHG